jgi:uncharacterized membrane protein YuzA (DUF378 family)
VTPSPSRDPGTGSTLRLLIGATLTVAALTTALMGFVRLVRVLEGGGYGTTAMRTSLVILGFAGALLAAGIATLIWEIAKRYESPGEPQVGDRDTSR